jgi:RNA polymerase sigma-70 factor (ECF subfamily)
LTVVDGGQVPTEFDQFYRAAYARLVGQLLAVTGSLDEAEDVVQEAFVRALARWATVHRYEAPELWVRRVALNLATSEFRRIRRHLAAVLRLRAQRPAPLLSDDTAAVIEILRDVPLNQRPVLLLHYVLDLPVEEVARQLALPVSTVRGRLARATARLRKRAGTDQADRRGTLASHDRA